MYGTRTELHLNICIIGDMYNRPNEQTSMAAVQGPNRHLGTQDRPRQTDKKNICKHVGVKFEMNIRQTILNK
jgi:hypothetical protein